MISLCILVIVFMGLIQASMLTLDVNVRNEVRDEGVRIAADTMTRLRQLAYDNGDLSVCATPLPDGFCPAFTAAGAPNVADLATINSPTRAFRNQSVTYTVTKNIVLMTNTKVVTVLVSWNFPAGKPVSHKITTTLRDPNAS